MLMNRPDNLTLNKICNLTMNIHIQWQKYANQSEMSQKDHNLRREALTALIDELYSITVRIKID